MRVVKVQGGLGNQLFCLGFAHTVATLTGEPVSLDVAAFASSRYGRAFALAPLAERLGMPLTRRPWLASRGVTALMRGVTGAPYVSESAAPTDRDALAALVTRGCYFNGYWQNELYLSDGFRALARAWLLEAAGDTPSRGLVIHYRTYQEELHPHRRAVPDATWFARCFERLRALGVDTAGARLISDDPALARSRLGDSARHVAPILGGTRWSDMATMLNARALILGNSSYSWWGGYCGAARTVLYPPPKGLFHYPHPAAGFEVVA